MTKKIFCVFCIALTVLVFSEAARAAGYAGYYKATGYDADGSGKITEDIDGFPANYAAHVELRDDGTYEMLYFAGLTSGEWEMMKTEKGNEFAGLLFRETVDKDLADRYENGELAFMLVQNNVGDYWLMQSNSDEVFYMEKQPGKFDVDKMLDEIEKHLTGED
jgi:hypothetical protein